MTPIDEAPKLAPFTLRGHNPDVLNTIANLSNDEVFTPPELANQMLDMLEKAWADGNSGANIWADHTVTFFDPFTKSGVFLREITARLVKGLEEWMPDLQQRVNHILTKQVFGIGITQLTSLLARRSVYCSKIATGKHSIVKTFDRDWGNIWFERTEHTWVGGTEKVITMDENGKTVLKATNGRCKYCGASQKEYERSDALESHAYAFIHTDDIKSRMVELFGENMHFDVVIGNPPYQLSDGGGAGSSAVPIYQHFIEQAQKLEPRLLTMIVPSKWFSGGKGLDSFRAKMLNDTHLRSLTDYPNSREAFDGVDVAGGVSYFLWDKDHEGPCEVTTVTANERTVKLRNLSEYEVFVRDNRVLEIIKKIEARNESALSEIVSARRPFDIDAKTPVNPEGDLYLYSSTGDTRIDSVQVAKGKDLLEKWKVLLSKTSSEHAGQTDKSGRKRVLSRIEVMPPGSVSTESYLVIGPFDSEQEASSAAAYLRTRFTRFLVASILLTQNITRKSFAFVPAQDFTRGWSETDLHEKYGLSQEDVAVIESQIKPMELGDE